MPGEAFLVTADFFLGPVHDPDRGCGVGQD